MRLIALLLIAACASRPAPGVSSIAVEVTPNPIVAKKISGTTYEFPFEVTIRETGGRAIEITRVSADVYALGLRIATEEYDAARIRGLGYSTTIPANGTVRYRFTQRRSVPNEALFNNVSADLHVEGRDETGATKSASTTVTVTK
jgi:hypothetical protein